jgi:ATP-dependent RNA helicase SUPV3L1/SUV3
LPRLPAPSASTLDGGADPRGAVLGFRRIGAVWLRVDLADRLATHAHHVKAGRGDDPIDHALATSLGLDADTLKRLMAEVGFVPAGEAWRWRGNHRQRSRPEAAPPGNAFAALASLKR